MQEEVLLLVQRIRTGSMENALSKQEQSRELLLGSLRTLTQNTEINGPLRCAQSINRLSQDLPSLSTVEGLANFSFYEPSYDNWNKAMSGQKALFGSHPLSNAKVDCGDIR